MASFPKPENALKRAEELINVGQKLDALQSLRDLITSKRHRAWQKPLEKIMFKYVELCVELQKGRFAKDGLIQYRIVCQQVNVTSLEEVIKHFLHLATERAELARNQAQALEEALDVDDFEADRRPEDLMISYVSGEKGKERSDRELVTPWFKFLWETYRTVLEILRNNSKLETLYSMTAHRAFQFCKQYKRATEFRRLCEIIRNHLTNLNKYRDQRDRPDLTSPETLQLYLDTRFEQLKIATELEMWQEAFRSIEDIHGLMCLVKKTPKPSMMVTYYAKLTEIFWISSSYLYHAYAWLRLFSVLKTYNKNLSQKDLQLSASSVVLAALSVPPYDMTYGASHMVLENKKEQNLRIANLIGFNLDGKPENRELLSRASLLLELGSRGVMTCVNPEVKDLFNLLEHDFVPLDLPSKVLPLLTKISKISGKLSSASSVPEVHLSHYIPALERLAILRLLHQVSQVYNTLKVDNLRRMVEDFGSCDVKKIMVEAVKHNFVEMKVNHIKGVIMFVHKGLESGSLTSHLSVFSELLNNARSIIYAPLQSQSKLSALLPTLPEVVEKEHRRLLARKLIIEKRKEEQERTLLEMEREEESKRLKLQKITQEAEQKRLATEYEQRKNQRIQREIEERELEEAQALLQEAEKRSKKKGKKALMEGEKVTKQSLMELAISEQLRERQEMEKKLQKLAKTMDHLERAKREVAAPLIESAFHHRMVEEKVLHDHEEQEAIKSSQARHDGDVKEKNRLSRMLENKVIFEERVIRCRRDEYERLKKERDERVAEIVRKRKQERDEKRKLLFFLRTQEEQRKRAHEEEEARKREEAERKKREEAEHKAKMDEVAEKQRRFMIEVEEKDRLRKEELLRGFNTTRTPSRDSDSAASVMVAEPVATAAVASTTASPGKYVPPKFKRAEAPPPEMDRWGSRRPERPTSDKWRSEDRRVPSFGGGSSRPSWSSSKYPARG